MLRAVRLAAKLNVAIDPKTAAPIPKLAPLIQNVPAARLFDEMQKLLLSGHAVETLRSLRAHGLSHGLLPMIDVILEQPLGQRFIELALADTDHRVRDGSRRLARFPVRDAALARGARDVEGGARRRRKIDSRRCSRRWTPCSRSRRRRSRYRAASRRRSRRSGRCSRASSNASGQRPHRLLQHPRFRAGWDFLDLRCRSGELEGDLADLASWWDRFANAGTDEREAMLKPDEGPKRRSRGRGRGRKRASGQPTAQPDGDPSPGEA